MRNRQEILNEFAREVYRILGKRLSKIILYGSYARGDYHEGSDMDLMILTDLSDQEIEKEEKKVFDLAFDFQMKYLVDISVIVKNEAHFRHWLGALPFYDKRRKRGGCPLMDERRRELSIYRIQEARNSYKVGFGVRTVEEYLNAKLSE